MSHIKGGIIGISSMIISLVTAWPAAGLTASVITPASGPLSGGNIVTIRGSGMMTQESEQFADLAPGVEHAVMLSNNGHVWTVGRNTYGQLGAGKLQTSYAVTPVDITDDFHLDSDDYIIGVASGDYHSFAISNNHRIFAWGKNTYGQLGDGTRVDRTQPVDITANVPLDAGDYVISISAGVDTSFALTNNGEVLVWGDSTDYQDGQTNRQYAARTKPEVATSWMGENVNQLSVGYKSAISLNANGMVMTWGRNQSGELGRTSGKEVNRWSPAESMYPIEGNFDLPEGDVIVDVEAGNGVMAVLTKYHRVYIWGDDRTGMLGLDGAMANSNDSVTGQDMSSTPIDITEQFDLADDDCISQISIGNSHVMALSQYGQVFSWGEGDYGQLGDGAMVGRSSINNITAEFDLPDGIMIQKVMAGGAGDSLIASYSYALDSAGNVYAWGGSAKGLPGINAINNQATPAMISERLVVDVPNVAGISFGDQIVSDYDVVGDEMMQVQVPSAIMAGRVPVTITDLLGNETTVAQEYQYTNETIGNLADDTAQGDNANDGAQDSDNGDKTDNADGDQDATQDSNDDSDDNSSDGNDNDQVSADDQATSGQIAAPNTGARLFGL